MYPKKSNLVLMGCGVIILTIAIIGMWLISPYIPASGSATTHFEIPPVSTDTRWVQTSMTRPEIPTNNTIITLQNATHLTETARWGTGATRLLTYSPDGKILAVVTALGPYLYDAKTLTLILWIKTYEDIQAATFNPDSTFLALATDNKIELYAVDDGTLIRTIDSRSSSTQQLAFDHTGTKLGEVSWDEGVQIWSVADGTRLHMITGHTDTIESFAYHPDGTMIATASMDGTVRLWQIEDGVELFSTRKPTLLSFDHAFGDISAGGYFYYSVAFSPDGTKLAAGDSSGYTYIWDVDGRRLLQARKHQISLRRLPLQFASNQTLFTISGEQWNFARGKFLRSFEGTNFQPISLALSPDGELMAGVDYEGRLGVWNLNDGAFIRGLRFDDEFDALFATIHFTPDGESLFVSTYDGRTTHLQLPHGYPLYTLHHGDRTVDILDVSPDGTLVATGNSNHQWEDELAGIVRIWRVEDGKLIYELKGHRWIEDVAFSPDSHMLATAGADENDQYPIRLWSMNDGKSLGLLSGHEFTVSSIQFTADGNHLWSIAEDETIREWDINKSEMIQQWEHSTYSRSRGPVFNDDGTLFAYQRGTRDTKVRIRSLTEEKPILVFDLQEHHVWSIAFSPENTIVAVGTSMGMIYLWDLEAKTLLYSFPAHTNSVNALTFNSTGTMLVSMGSDSTIRFWQVTP